MKKYIDFNDNKISIGKRKQAYVKWAISKGTDEIIAKRQANIKFKFEQKEGILAVVTDMGGMFERYQWDEKECYGNTDLRKYKHYKWIKSNDVNRENIINNIKNKGWDIIYTYLQD